MILFYSLIHSDMFIIQSCSGSVHMSTFCTNVHLNVPRLEFSWHLVSMSLSGIIFGDIVVHKIETVYDRKQSSLFSPRYVE